jgi:signal transduction histidine kinase
MAISTRRESGIELLLGVVQELSLARDLPRVMAIVRGAARRLSGADGATFVLRESEFCHYADEDAISPLWKGRRFPLSSCISGWSMLNKQAAIIEDIYADPRIPIDAYRPTFVRSLVMVPIRSREPIGAIGTYWAERHRASEEEVELLQALADSTSVAMENVAVYTKLENRVRQRTIELQRANKELESFSYSVAHDLRTPLGVIEGYSELLTEHFSAELSERVLKCIRPIPQAAARMRSMIDGLLTLSQVTRGELIREDVDLSALASAIVADLRSKDPERPVEVFIESGLKGEGDAALLRCVLENLLGNAWKYTKNAPAARISFGARRQGSETVYSVTDNGVGFDEKDADRLFVAFGRLHAKADFPGNGIGLATVQRIIERHGGRVWGEGKEGQGASFFFTLQPEGALAKTA